MVQVRLGRCLVSLRVLCGEKEAVSLEPDTYLNDCYQTWLKEQLSDDAVPSVVQDAAPLLGELGLDCQLRSPLSAGLMVADIVTGREQQKFALEPRPRHLTNAPRHILGEAHWRFRMLDGKTQSPLDSLVSL